MCEGLYLHNSPYYSPCQVPKKILLLKKNLLRTIIDLNCILKSLFKMVNEKESSKNNSLEGEETFLKSLKRINQVKVNLNDEELGLLNNLVRKLQSDKSSVLRMLLNSQTSGEKQVIRTGNNDDIFLSNEVSASKEASLPIKYLEELKEVFEKSLINEDEYKALKSKALGLD